MAHSSKILKRLLFESFLRERKNKSPRTAPLIMAMEKEYRIDSEPVKTICAHFGCGKTLTLIQQLAGNKCNDHAKAKKVDPVMVIKFK